MEEGKTLSETLNSLQDRLKELEEAKKIKRFSLPFKAKVGRFKRKKGYASICYIKNNRSVILMKAPIQDGVIDIDGTPHLALPKHTLNYKNKAFLIVPEWNTEPFSPEENYDKAAAEGTRSIGLKHLANYLEAGQLKTKGKGSFVAIIFGLVVLGAIGYYVYKSGVLG